MNPPHPRQGDSSEVGLGITGIPEEGYEALSGPQRGLSNELDITLQHWDHHRFSELSPSSTLTFATSPGPSFAPPQAPRLPSSSTFPNSTICGEGVTTNLLPPSQLEIKRSLGAQEIWQAEKLWDVDPDKLDDEEVEVLGALLPVIKVNDDEETQKLRGQRRRVAIASTTTKAVEMNEQKQQQSSDVSRSMFPSRESRPLSDRTSSTSLRNLLDRPLPPLPATQRTSGVTCHSSAYAFNQTPPLSQIFANVSPSQTLDSQMELFSVPRGDRSSGGSFQTTPLRLGRSESRRGDVGSPWTQEIVRKKLVPREACSSRDGRPIQFRHRQAIGGTGSDSEGEDETAVQNRNSFSRRELEEENVDEDRDEFAIAFLQTPPPTPPTSAVMRGTLLRHSGQAPFTPNHLSPERPTANSSRSTGSLVTPPRSPPTAPLPALPPHCCHTAHEHPSSDVKRPERSVRTSISSVPAVHRV